MELVGAYIRLVMVKYLFSTFGLWYATLYWSAGLIMVPSFAGYCEKPFWREREKKLVFYIRKSVVREIHILNDVWKHIIVNSTQSHPDSSLGTRNTGKVRSMVNELFN